MTLTDQELALTEIRIPCVSVWQPFADLIFEVPEGLECGPKDIENRSRPYSYRGPLLIHATKKRPRVNDKHWSWLLDYLSKIRPMNWDEWIAGRAFEYGKVIGVVDLVDCVDGHSSPWAEKERHNWILQNSRRFGWPIPARGWPGIWYPRGIVEQLKATNNDIGWTLSGGSDNAAAY